VITIIAIKERKGFTASSRIYNLIYMRQAKWVLRVVFIEIVVINAHPPLFILLLNVDWIS
jgi:hypothetical protein